MLVFLERGGDGGGGWLGRKCVCGDDSVDASDGMIGRSQPRLSLQSSVHTTNFAR